MWDDRIMRVYIPPRR